MKKVMVSLGMCFLTSIAAAGSADQITVQDPYVRLVPPSAAATGAFMVLKNTGPKDVQVVRAENSLTKVTELHTHLNDQGVMRMRPVPQMDIKAQSETVLKPGGLHVMVMDLKSPLAEGQKVGITLHFQDGSTKTIEAPVRPITVTSGMEHHRH